MSVTGIWNPVHECGPCSHSPSGRLPPTCLPLLTRPPSPAATPPTHTHSHPTPPLPQVVCTEGTLAAAEAARREGRPCWRVSSTVFSQIASDVVLAPLGRFAELPGAAEAYPRTPAGRQVAEELEMINLKA